MRTRGASAWAVASLVLCGLFFTMLFYGPLGFLVLLGLSQSVGVLVPDAYFSHLVQFTYTQAALSAMLAAVPGMVGALVYSESAGRTRRWLSSLSLVPFALPPILVVLGVLGIWGKQGPVGHLARAIGVEWNGIYGWAGILMAHALFNFPLYIRFVGQALAARDRLVEQAALSLGSSRLRCFGEITWPAIRLSFWNAFGLSFLFSASSFLVVLVLGGSPRFSTIEVAVYQAIKQDFNLGYAVRLALVQLGVASVLCLWLFRQPGSAGPSEPGVALYRPRNRWAWGACQLVYAALLLGWVGSTLGVVLVRGLPGLWPFSVWVHGLRISLELAFWVGALATVVGWFGAYGARHIGVRGVGLGFSILCTLPLAVSSLMVLLAWRVSVPEWFAGQSGLFWGVVLVQAVLAVAIVYRPIEQALGRIPQGAYRVARSLGATPLKTLWLLELPACRNALLLAWLLGAAVSIGEAGAVLLFLDESTMNLTYLIYQKMGRYRFNEANASGCVLLLLTVGLCALATKLERRVEV